MRSPWGIALAIAMMASGCDSSAEAEARVLCSTICRCTAVPLPVTQERCVDLCSRDEDILSATQQCAECIFTHANRCGSLVADCEPFCDTTDPLPEENLDDTSSGGGDR